MAIAISALAIQSCDNKTESNEKQISVNEVPSAVQQTFSTKYTDASAVTWEDAHEDGSETYKVKFTFNGKKMKAEFNADGSLIKEKEDS